MSRLPVDVPVDPDRDEARRLLEDELAKSRYQQGEQGSGTPDWLERLYRWFDELTHSLGGENTVPAWVVVLVVVGIAVLVVAFLVFGVPRLRRRSALAAGDELFEADDRRDAAAMRRDADAAARDGRWGEAIAERFRAIARSLHERTLVTTVPGSTAHDVARRAAAPLPEHAPALERAASDFDAVRYLGEAGDRERYERLVALDDAIQRSRPRLDGETATAEAPSFARVES
ncbi:DUF4129 domain-containing protein [Protaetiibacter sp. 10F1B-8-1]|uniref:DUF4129 domain-containing protein n=2 Tax=Protaetiibacter mangrovi TaxID=2970926 RepID=A0ABT1ZHN8_9MICO|nr:DUF4129 domain-containing protein [Protaetiibacter mangrovi]